ncbi:Beta-glucosidase [Fulvivirga imtechensis AK7]|uniref:Periplasmic beta-glucosidase n=1 Tax=Fulvivirga imtechensis AK7 TaxID=1237149 RepID=L8JSU5_9BACT|nr:beta-glucosidase BglX [Fulvivirga imtechensis]ELR70569.1 Beta-glucosidase [Fulvivirga imtechensis AK7]
MKKIPLFFISFIFYGCLTEGNRNQPQTYENPKIEALIRQMTLEEKVGQLNFYVGDLFNTGPTVRTTESDKFDQLIREGKLTGLFNVHGAAYTGRLQKIAVEESRLGIPLLFGADVIHGFKTVFPIPLASAASWDLEAIEKAERVAAIESTAAGINFNFAPMVDISRDPRWGRIAEGAGEDPFLGSEVAKARVRGFQEQSLTDPQTMAACVKHFAAYGAPDGGRDYNTVDMSERLLREMYLPPYKAGIDAGAATIMTSFNELNGIAASGSQFLLRDILRKEWGFKGMVVSDWQSVNEMVAHGNAANNAEAAMMALKAGVDMDMMGDVYLEEVPRLVNEGKLDIKFVDEAVRNVLKLKYDLGLFDDPYRYSDTIREKNNIRAVEHLEAARDVAKKSIVLLKNKEKLLPLKKSIGTIAVIGPLADNQADMNGTWSFFGEAQHPITFLQGIKDAVSGQSRVLYAEGCNLYDRSKDKFAEAVNIAKKADVVILAVGESAVMNGEAGSRSDIRLPGIQPELVMEIAKTGKPVVALVMSGRPLDLSWLDENIPAILEVWTLGSEAGNAAADVLFGDYNPSGKLPVTFPRNVGQVPIYYNHKNTGRPYEGDYSEPLSERIYRSKYRDVQNSPLYPFGYGLSYSTFEYSDITLSADTLNAGESITASVSITNEGPYDGEEVVQLYIRDLVGSVTRPVKELKGFKKLMIKNGETVKVDFTLSSDDLSFYRHDMTYGIEPGDFQIFIGSDSKNVKEQHFVLKN